MAELTEPKSVSEAIEEAEELIDELDEEAKELVDELEEEAEELIDELDDVTGGDVDEDDIGLCDGATNTIASTGAQIMIAVSLTKMLFF